MLKKDELRTPTSCLNKAESNEPIFVFRAKDILAPMAIRHWATMADGVHEPDKVQEALELAQKMEDWHNQNIPAVPAPPEPPRCSS